ncbi:hypothetical protein EV363DRAFT_1400560 [Boletus edulis]|nr:hypothetical protein EV363DRAFT_1400560 [Boletus edulis]
MQQQYAQRIWEQVGQATSSVGPEVKAMNPPKPRKYGGQNDLEKFNEWLSHLLKYYHTFKVTEPNHDEDRILYTGLYLEGLASQWYDQENTADQFDCMRFSHEKGALACYNDLKRKFLRGLPHSIIKSIYEARGISAEHSMIKEILKEVWHMETAQKAINMHMSGSHQHNKKESGNPTKGGSPRYVKKGDTIYHCK